MHGNSHMLPSKSRSFMERQNVKVFITAYARDNVLPLPGRLSNYKQRRVFFCHPDQGLNDILVKYEEATTFDGMRSISL